jgi:hypothetical protein
MAEPINDVNIPAEKVISQLGDELGILSVIVVQKTLKLAAALQELSRVNAENEGLRSRVLARDADVAALREQVVAKRKK